jgi:hypothetical protein
MTQSVIHQPRVAWDAARVFVRAAGSSDYEQFAGRVYQQLGIEVFGELSDTRKRLILADAALPGDQYVIDVEAAKWRVRLEELLRSHPGLVSTIQDLSH